MFLLCAEQHEDVHQDVLRSLLVLLICSARTSWMKPSSLLCSRLHVEGSHAARNVYSMQKPSGGTVRRRSQTSSPMVAKSLVHAGGSRMCGSSAPSGISKPEGSQSVSSALSLDAVDARLFSLLLGTKEDDACEPMFKSRNRWTCSLFLRSSSMFASIDAATRVCCSSWEMRPGL